ncbi:Molybdopterin biosynthesis enzyme MoeA-2 [Methanocella conradii HZ254]|uniref:Molybdopterin biosynthesis enzyme MoeA-2 n=1 Tax=Methanocella conradii (strain DSM 24694 / JCM 17849 / CGMCC 1.5162 / HZ254) TaxID=1041930 RepID=H8I937_METCZ|nr:gephyrin-like molybdotransferase Glp [Methanocella conradii]AFC99040.1 Molybdopterin biosynthesis enzyme MoeA-2 [Methanocella conradii HZ254]
MPLKSGFRSLASVEDALDMFLGSLEPLNRVEMVSLEEAGERVLAADVRAPRDVPHYDRSAMDGYAVVASDTFGSGKDAGVILKLTSKDSIVSGECRQVHTGSPIPEGADAVVMLEYTEAAGDGVEVLAQVSPGQNIGLKGEDVRKGDIVFREGRLLKPSDVGLLASMGLTEVAVYAKPRVLIIPTGEEIVPRGVEPAPGQMNESNGVMNYLYVKRFGGVPTVHGIVSDVKEELAAALDEGASYDLIVTTGGSSVGKRDLIAEVLASKGTVLVHGVAIKPGKPVALGLVDAGGKRTPIVCLPGYPAACAVDSMVFVDPAVKKLGHMPPAAYRTQKAILTRKIYSEAGYRTYTRVSVEEGRATPLRTKGAGVLSSISRADGYVITPPDVEGHEAGEEVEVTFLE